MPNTTPHALDEDVRKACEALEAERDAHERTTALLHETERRLDEVAHERDEARAALASARLQGAEALLARLDAEDAALLRGIAAERDADAERGVGGKARRAMLEGMTLRCIADWMDEVRALVRPAATPEPHTDAYFDVYCDECGAVNVIGEGVAAVRCRCCNAEVRPTATPDGPDA